MTLLLCFICKVIDYLCTILAGSRAGKEAPSVEAFRFTGLRALTDNKASIVLARLTRPKNKLRLNYQIRPAGRFGPYLARFEHSHT